MRVHVIVLSPSFVVVIICALAAPAHKNAPISTAVTKARRTAWNLPANTFNPAVGFTQSSIAGFVATAALYLGLYCHPRSRFRARVRTCHQNIRHRRADGLDHSVAGMIQPRAHVTHRLVVWVDRW